jgi:hypothetical protein
MGVKVHGDVQAEEGRDHWIDVPNVLLRGRGERPSDGPEKGGPSMSSRQLLEIAAVFNGCPAKSI